MYPPPSRGVSTPLPLLSQAKPGSPNPSLHVSHHTITHTHWHAACTHSGNGARPQTQCHAALGWQAERAAYRSRCMGTRRRARLPRAQQSALTAAAAWRAHWLMWQCGSSSRLLPAWHKMTACPALALIHYVTTQFSRMLFYSKVLQLYRA